MSDSGKVPEASRSPAVPHRLPRTLQNERTRELHQSLFVSDDGYSDELYYSSPRSTRASSHERNEDGKSRRHTGIRGTGKDTTSERDILKP